MTRSVHVELADRAYDVLIGGGLIARSGDLIAPLLKRRRVAVVADETVAGLHAAALAASLEAAGITAPTLTIPSGEASKSFERLADLSDRLLALELDRGDLIVAFGGGVVVRLRSTGCVFGGRAKPPRGRRDRRENGSPPFSGRWRCRGWS